jgi:hypothetical protein
MFHTRKSTERCFQKDTNYMFTACAVNTSGEDVGVPAGGWAPGIYWYTIHAWHVLIFVVITYKIIP